MKLNPDAFRWTRNPRNCSMEDDRITITTAPHTDLWQRTYYHFRNDSAPVLQMQCGEDFFTFQVKVDFEYGHRFDQCGIVLYLDGENWLKASIECENERFGHLGSVVTNQGYSDWATTRIDADVHAVWYRLSRRKDDFRIDFSLDGVDFQQMRVCHMAKAVGTVSCGIYACSPEESSFTAVFSDMQQLECQWQAHDGQQPDPD